MRDTMRRMQRILMVLLPALTVLTAPMSLWSEEQAAAEWAGLSAEEGWSLFSSDTDDTLAFEFTFGLTAQRMYEMLDAYESPELDRSLRGQRAPRSWYDTTEAILDYRSRYLSLFVDWAMINDERYDPSEPYMRGRYLYIKDAHVQVDRRPFLIKAGRTTQTDVIDSPYSLFVNFFDFIPAFFQLSMALLDFLIYNPHVFPCSPYIYLHLIFELSEQFFKLAISPAEQIAYFIGSGCDGTEPNGKYTPEFLHHFFNHLLVGQHVFRIDYETAERMVAHHHA